MDGWVLTVERMIRASPEVIFDVLADPSKHAPIDGSGMLQGAKDQGARDQGAERLALGTTFGMSMKMGVHYSTVSTVVEFEENRLIAWQTGPKGRLEPFVAGRIWRYELDPQHGSTLVRESWDITNDHQRTLLKLGDIWSGKTRRDMELTLARLDTLVTSSTPMGDGS
ncbi:MAG: SRPBCC family protein [Acidimicrobiales bacterium]